MDTPNISSAHFANAGTSRVRLLIAGALSYIVAWHGRAGPPNRFKHPDRERDQSDPSPDLYTICILRDSAQLRDSMADQSRPRPAAESSHGCNSLETPIDEQRQVGSADDCSAIPDPRSRNLRGPDQWNLQGAAASVRHMHLPTPMTCQNSKMRCATPHVGFRGYRICHHSVDVCCRGFLGTSSPPGRSRSGSISWSS